MEDGQQTEAARWIGLTSEKFQPYQNWKTPNGFLCGTYASAVLLAYYQDNVAAHLLPPTVRVAHDPTADTLAPFLKPMIQRFGLPTVPVQVASGLNRFFRQYQVACRARFTSVGSWTRVTRRIAAGQPVLISILRVLGSTYGNHWVVAYAYQETAAGERFYKIHDNWGAVDAVIPARWANGTVTIC
jgi:hypothetical protein